MAKKTEKKAEDSQTPSIEVQSDQLKETIHAQIEAQKQFFKTNTTKSIKWRLNQLKALYASIKNHEAQIMQALNSDLAKSEFEAYVTEEGFALHEITVTKKNLKKWAKAKKASDILSRPGKGKVILEPFGTVLIIAPWNYPFVLAMQPLVSAIASGNTVVLKCSEYSPATNEVIKSIIQEVFPPEHVLYVEPGYQQNQILMHEHFDFIFFTGSPKVGRQIMESASKFLTPVCLELGGKSPCIIEESANISQTAKRIIWGKLLNAGQTCVAPDYILVHNSIKDSLIKTLYEEIEVQYGEDILSNPEYPKIVNSRHFTRLYSMVPEAKVDTTTNKMAPVILDLGALDGNEAQNHPAMKEEIFGPLLPVISYENIDDAIDFVYSRPTPLALYLFTKNKKIQKKVFGSLRFGGGCLNDVINHLCVKGLPFGGIGESGMGNYHGEYGFKTFSHEKSILFQPANKELKYRYAPHKVNLDFIKKFLK